VAETVPVTSPALAIDGGPAVRSSLLVFGRPNIGAAERAEVDSTLVSGWPGTGPRVARFEQEMAAYLEAEHVAAVGSGTAALHLAMLAAGVGPGDEVILPTMTFAATANAVVHTGATPVLVDVDPRSQNLDLDGVAAACSPRTRAVIPVHFGGYPCPMADVQELARRRGLVVIEDAAHCIEGRSGGRKIGSIGDATCFSFHVTKNMTTVEGGLVATNHGAWLDQIRTNAIQGLTAGAWSRFSDRGYAHYEVVEPGFKYNMTDLQAAVGLHQLPQIEAWSRRRAELWARYDEAFDGLPLDRPSLPDERDGRERHARHLYTIHLRLDELRADRDQVMHALHAEGIGTGVHYVALHLQPYYQKTLDLSEADYPVATRISRRTLSVPFTASLTDDEADEVVRAVTKVLRAYCA
jgi:dTDP-4-amino-4,6-dideoxygalactose transaminase